MTSCHNSSSTNSVPSWRWTLVWICLGCLALASTKGAQLRVPKSHDNDKNSVDQQEEFLQQQQHRTLLQVDSLREAFQLEKAKYYNKLEVDYGAQYTDILFRANHPTIPDRESSIGRLAFSTSIPNANVRSIDYLPTVGQGQNAKNAILYSDCGIWCFRSCRVLETVLSRLCISREHFFTEEAKLTKRFVACTRCNVN